MEGSLVVALDLIPEVERGNAGVVEDVDAVSNENFESVESQASAEKLLLSSFFVFDIGNRGTDGLPELEDFEEKASLISSNFQCIVKIH